MSKRTTVQPTAYDPFDPIGSERRMLEAFRKAADAFDRKHTRSKAAAIRQLKKEGILTEDGKLSPRYGG